MKSIRLRAAVAALVLAAGATESAAESGVDYSFTKFVSIDSNSPDAPNVVNTVVVVCPAAGTLIATASAQIHMSTFDGSPGQPSVQYGISRNSRKAQLSSYHLISQYHGDAGFTDASAHYQRTNSCQADDTVTFRVVVHRIDAGSASAENASLVVQWVGDPRI